MNWSHSRLFEILAARKWVSREAGPRSRAWGYGRFPRSFRAGVIVPDGLNRIVLHTACYHAGLATVQYWTPLDYVRCWLSDPLLRVRSLAARLFLGHRTALIDGGVTRLEQFSRPSQ